VKRNRREYRPRALQSVVAAALLLTLAPAAVDARQIVRFVGSVQWIAGTTMQVMTDTGVSVVAEELWRDSGKGYWTQSP
jgi:hypothetical protein